MLRLFSFDESGSRSEIFMEISHFPDNSLHLKINFEEIDDPDLIMVDWRYENDSELFTLAAIKNKIDEEFYNTFVELLMPYIPHARMDRVESCTDCFTLKTFSRILNSFRFDLVRVLDPHSNVSVSLIDNIVEEPVKYFIKGTIRNIKSDNLILFYPDEGAVKRYSNEIRKPYTFGIKSRDWSTGKIKSLDIVNKELIQDKDVLIIDDICSRGGTFLRAAEGLKSIGAKDVYLYITHAEDTMYEGEMYRTPDLIKHIYTTNSIQGGVHRNYTPEKVTIYKIDNWRKL